MRTYLLLKWKKKKQYGYSMVLCLAMVFFLVGCGEDWLSLPTFEIPEAMTGKLLSQKSLSCDFDVEIKEGDFCVIEESVHDVDVTLIPTAGVCEGPATISISGLPVGVTHEILPDPKIRFIKSLETPDGIAMATIRIDTAGVTLKEGMATSSLIVTASKKALIRKAKADMTIDKASFDFSLTSPITQLKMHVDDEEPPSSVDVSIKLLGAGCRLAPPVGFWVDAPSLPPVISYNLSDESVVPPNKVTLSLKASSKPGSPSEIGDFGIALVGCCTEEGLEKSLQVNIDAVLPKIPDATVITLDEDGEGPDVKALMQTTQGRRFAVDTFENIAKIARLPKEAIEQNKKNEEDLDKKGYIEATEESVSELKYIRVRARPMEAVRKILTFEPVSLKNTSFERFQFAGGDPSGVLSDGKWMTLDRIFDMPNGSLVGLTEDDPRSSGSVIMAKESINDTVNNHPAILVVLQSPSGTALTEMHWVTQTTKYVLTMEGNVKKNGQYPFFLEMARSIPITSKGNSNDSETTKTLSSTQESISEIGHHDP